ncbi:OmpA family protein [Desulfohalovibrio reitneri]|uniref:OmpA family protein n=1 Tax=Desulfohalovibrio reitneri TaxID=1307759 RepID=UPI00068AAC54|nr:OmpA family protein [Desulfohalovibrio reitneri]
MNEIRVVFAGVFLAVLLAASGASAAMEAKVDRFAFQVDTSGSMRGCTAGGAAMSKAEQARDLLARVNKALPELDWRAGLATSSPYRELLTSARYTTEGYGQAIDMLPGAGGYMFGNPTTLGDGLRGFGADNPDFDAPSALILMSDGANNQGRNPVAMAEGVVEDNPGMCLYAVSYAETGNGRALLEKIVAEADCGEVFDATDLDSEQGLNSFVQKVFLKEGKDTDGDGVDDADDRCPGTPAGVEVDQYGCPFDTDKDGVPDYRDKCPGTPTGAPVDADGCALDSDGDGVIDFYDKCPGTPKQMKVDETGCAIPTTITLDIQFDVDSAEIKPAYRAELDRIGRLLRDHPGAMVEIGGHTDSTGSAAYNEKLSQRRAESVKSYIENNFNIDGDRLDARGYGESRPVASNQTKAGRAGNRRVEAKVSGTFEQR